MEVEKILTNTNWHFWHIRKRSPLMLYVIGNGPSNRQLKNFPFKLTLVGTCLENMITNEIELKKYGNKIWKIFKKDNNALLTMMKGAYLKNIKDVKKWQKIFKLDLSKISDKKLLIIYNQYIESLLNYGPYLFNPLAAESLMTAECDRYLKSKFNKDWPKYENLVMRPIKNSHTLLEKESLLKIATKNKNLQTKLIKKHQEQFSFLKSKEFFMDFFDMNYYQSKLSKINKPKIALDNFINENKIHQKLFRTLLNKIKGDSYGQKLLQTVNESIFFRTWRTEKIVQSSFYMQKLFREIANRIGLENEKQIVYLLPSEINDYLKNKKSFPGKLISDRIKGYIFLSIDKKNHYLFEAGEKAIAIGEKMSFNNDTSENLMIGNTAYQGLVTGRVIVVKDKTQYDKIAGGEILVAHSTVPDMVPYMKKVKAVITEEGGILSHAALISRELKIPCIIGVKNITKILKNNDLVKVDANIGKITKLTI